jgi:hypothetical protein
MASGNAIAVKEAKAQEDLCPLPTLYPGINIANHLQCIELANLGPANPKEANDDFWQAKAKKWKVSEGEARSRLCMNCEHYKNTPENMKCIQKNAGGKVKASDLPLVPKWTDIDGLPSAVCSRFNITCTSIRTCDDWETCCADWENPAY